MYECAGQSRVRESVRYITHDSCAISVVSPFNINFIYTCTSSLFLHHIFVTTLLHFSYSLLKITHYILLNTLFT